MLEGFVSTMALMAFVAIIGPVARIAGLQPWQVGVAITLAGLAWFFAASLWGRAADRFGRKRVLLWGLGGFALSSSLLSTFMHAALHWSWPALSVFLAIALARTMAGAFYAAVPASSVALIADNFAPHRRAGAIASLGAANGLGMVMGPAAAGALAPWGMSYPLALIVALPIIAFVVIWRLLAPDAPASAKTTRLRLGDKRVRMALIAAFVAMTCVGAAQICVGFFAMDRLGLDPARAARTAGFALAAVGVALIAAQAIVRLLNWSEVKLIRTGAIVSAFGFCLTMFAASEALVWLAYFVGAAGMGLVFPAFYALAANGVEAHEQGAAAGAVSSVQGLGSVIGPITGALLYEANLAAPYLMITGLLVALALMVRAPVRRRPFARAWAGP